MYRTFANIAEAGDRVPTDRAIDSIDQSDFLFSTKETSNRESVMFFHGGELLAVKWRNFKVHFAMRDSPRGEVVAAGQGVTHGAKTSPNYPWIFDLENDPKELWDIGFTTGWVGTPVGRLINIFEKSVARFPSVKPGSEGPEGQK
jgi:hypothetical protein